MILLLLLVLLLLLLLLHTITIIMAKEYNEIDVNLLIGIR